jgi:hypothetical protein
MYSDWTLLMAQPGPNFNEQRRVFRQVLGPHVVGQYDALIQRHLDSFCGALSGVSGNPFPVIVECVAFRSEPLSYPLTLSLSTVGAIVAKLGYGEKVYQAHGEELVGINRQRIELITWVFTQFWMVDVFPLCKFFSPSQLGKMLT